MARPRVKIDQTEFEKLCGLQCALEEIADWFDCSSDTIERWCKRTYKDDEGNPLGFAEVFAKKRGRGKIALRRAQFELAKKSAAMAIFLGKNYLGQTDRQEIVAASTGQLEDLINGLREPCVYDLHTEAADDDGAVEDESAQEN